MNGNVSRWAANEARAHRALRRAERADVEASLPAGVRCIQLKDLEAPTTKPHSVYRTGPTPAEHAAAAAAVRASMRSTGVVVLQTCDYGEQVLRNLLKTTRAPLHACVSGDTPLPPGVARVAGGGSALTFHANDELSTRLGYPMESACISAHGVLFRAGRRVLAALSTPSPRKHRFLLADGSRAPLLSLAECSPPVYNRGASPLAVVHHGGGGAAGSSGLSRRRVRLAYDHPLAHAGAGGAAPPRGRRRRRRQVGAAALPARLRARARWRRASRRNPRRAGVSAPPGHISFRGAARTADGARRRVASTRRALAPRTFRRIRRAASGLARRSRAAPAPRGIPRAGLSRGG